LEPIVGFQSDSVGGGRGFLIIDFGCAAAGSESALRNGGSVEPSIGEISTITRRAI